MSDVKVRQKYDVCIDGVSIRTLSPLLRVTGIREQIVRPEIELEPYPGMSGQILMSNYRRELSVQITFVLAEIYNLTARAQAIDAVNAWAKAGKLEVNYRPDKVLFVNAVSEYPTIDKIKDLTGEYSLTLSAYSVPFWVDAVPVTTESFIPTLEDGATVTMQMTGNQMACLECTADVQEGTLTQFSIWCDETSTGLTLTVSASAGDVLHIDYDDNHFLRVYADEGGIMQGALGASPSDHVLLQPGANTVHVTVDAKCSVILSARGVYA